MSKKLTNEQKERFAPLLHATWQGIAPDCEAMLSKGRSRVGEIVEITCDADHPVTNGGMTPEDYKALLEAYRHRDTKKWLRQILNY